MSQKLIDPSGRFYTLINPVVEDAGYRLVRAILTSHKQYGQILQIMIEPGTKPDLNLDDCAAVSRSLSAVLEVEDPVAGAYRLEVSTPGIDKPLTCFEDFCRFTGHEARIELDMPLPHGQKKFRGLLKSACDGIVTIQEDGKEQEDLAFENIKSASLILTDALIEFTKQNKTLTTDL